jgi:hypothetical protein
MPTEIDSVSTPVAVPTAAPAPVSVRIQTASGNALPPGGKPAPAGVPVAARVQGPPPQPAPQAHAQPLVAALNKFLNDSGRPNQYRVDPAASTQIQEINPANGAVIGEFAIRDFRALAQSIGATSLLVDTHV